MAQKRVPWFAAASMLIIGTPGILAADVPAAGGGEHSAYTEMSGTSVSVTPDGGEAEKPGYTSNNSVEYTATLVEGNSGNFSLSCSIPKNLFGDGEIVSCSVSDEEILIVAGAPTDITVNFETGKPGLASLRLTLSPVSCSPEPCSGDFGTYDVTIVDPPEPTIVTRYPDLRLDPRTAWSRRAGPPAQFRPHELSVRHRIPGYTTLDQERSVGLVYSSQSGSGRIAIPFDVKLNANTPEELTARLEIDGVQEGEEIYFSTSGWDDGETRRLALLFDGSGYSTGSYPYRIVVTSVYDATGYEGDISGRLGVVNETGSVYGSGWRVAGVQRLYSDSDTITIVGCDCSAEAHGYRIFYPLGGGDYSAPPGEHSTLTQITGGWKLERKDGTVHYFDGSGFQDSTVDRNGNVTEYAYDGSGRLTDITDPVGWTTSFTYSSGQVDVSIPGGRTATLTISNGELTKITDPDGSEVSFGYDGDGRLDSRTSKRGNQTSYFYDHGWLPDSVSLPITASRSYSSPHLEGLADYPNEGTSSNPKTAPDTANVSGTYTDARGHDWVLSVDGESLAPTVLKDPLGDSTTWARRPDGQPTQRVLPNGRDTRYSYDGRGNLTQVHELTNDARWTYSYDTTYNNLTEIITPNSDTTVINYDPDGNPNELIFPEDSVWKREYNEHGQVERILRFTLAPDDTLRQYEAADSFFYDETDSWNTVKIKRIYGLSTTDTVGFSHDAAGRVTAVRDDRGGEVEFAYDAMNRVTSRTDQLAEVESRVYNAAGLDSVWTNRRGETVTYTYDALDRLTRKVGDQTADFEYDAEGNLTRAYDDDSDIHMYYDELGRDTLVDQDGQDVRYTYHAGMPDRKTMVDPDGGTHTYTFDDLSRMTQIEDPEGELTTFAYDSLNRRTQRTQGNGVETAYEYDGNSRVTRIESTYSTTTYASFDYTYEPQGWRSSWTYDDGRTYSFDHDFHGQLISATLKDSDDTVLESDDFDYDGAHNRTSGGDYSGYSYNAANRLTSTNTSTYAYDLDGNLIEEDDDGSLYTYSYDREGRLVSQTGPGFTITYTYDALGRRIEQDVDGTVTKFVYDGPHVLMDLDGADNTIARYTHGPRIDEIVSVRRDGETYYYLQDALHSVVAILDSARVTENEYEYTAWGQIRSETETISNRFTYTGRAENPDGRTMHYRSRTYLPGLGRFQQEDELGFAAGVNLYTYVGNSPCTLIDPYGLQGCEEEGATAAVTGAGAAGLTIALFSMGPFTGGVTAGIGLAVAIATTYGGAGLAAGAYIACREQQARAEDEEGGAGGGAGGGGGGGW